MHLFFVLVEIDLTSESGIKLDKCLEQNDFVYGDRKILGFSAWIDIHLVFVSGR